MFSNADSPEKMIKLSVKKIQKIIRPCGLSPMKSNGIYESSKIIIDQHNGKVPKSFVELEALPSVGHKTASVVMSQAFGVPAFPVDTHIHRLMYRWGFSNGKSVETTEKDAKDYFLRIYGINCICKLFITLESILLQEDGILKEILFSIKLEENHF